MPLTSANDPKPIPTSPRTADPSTTETVRSEFGDGVIRVWVSDDDHPRSVYVDRIVGRAGPPELPGALRNQGVRVGPSRRATVRPRENLTPVVLELRRESPSLMSPIGRPGDLEDLTQTQPRFTTR